MCLINHCCALMQTVYGIGSMGLAGRRRLGNNFTLFLVLNFVRRVFLGKKNAAIIRMYTYTLVES